MSHELSRGAIVAGYDRLVMRSWSCLRSDARQEGDRYMPHNSSRWMQAVLTSHCHQPQPRDRAALTVFTYRCYADVGVHLCARINARTLRELDASVASPRVQGLGTHHFFEGCQCTREPNPQPILHDCSAQHLQYFTATLHSFLKMDSFMLQDEGVRDRIRQAEEFLDPSKLRSPRGASC